MCSERASRRDILRTLAATLGLAGTVGVASGKKTLVDGDPTAAVSDFGSGSETSDVGNSITQIAKLTANDGNSNDEFGTSVAVSEKGTTAVIGAQDDEGSTGNFVGSAYVFEQATRGWQQEAKLTADDSDSDSDDFFGASVSVSDDGNTAIIGAPGDEGPNGLRAGSMYVFEQDSGVWNERIKLTAADGDSGDKFGASVSLSGDGTTAIIGAYDGDSNGTSAGAAYVFSRSVGAWQQEAKLTANDGDSDDFFGASVSISEDGSTAVIGAWNDEDPNGTSGLVGGAGSAYVFEQATRGWQQRTKLVAEDGDSDDEFGASVAVSADGTTAIVGAQDDEHPNGDRAGSVYVFEQGTRDWQQRTKLAAEDGDSYDSFGAAVGVSDDGSIAMVGATRDEDPNGYQAGSAYVFEQGTRGWQQRTKLAPDDGDPGDEFGVSVSVSGDASTALIGGQNDDDPNGYGSGSAYVFGQVTIDGESAPATDIDGDGLLEDVNGDGESDIADVLTYYNNRKSDAIRSNPTAFDFDGDGTSGTVFDALKLYDKISR